MKRVSKEEYEKFLAVNDDRLIVQVSGISEPPAINHYDRRTGFIMAHTFDGSDEYYIKDLKS